MNEHTKEGAGTPAPLLMQDENSGKDGRRYNEWHASRPDARLNAREAAHAAVMPAAPSDAEWKCGNEFLPYHPSASHVNPDYRDGWNACYQAALSQTMQPQAEHPTDIPPASDAERGLTDAERRMLNALFLNMSDLSDKDWRDHGFRRATFDRLESKLRSLNYSVRPQAEPAAGEQAGAVADAQLQALWDEACKDSPGNPGWSRHLRFGRSVARIAAPGAAIAAREQDTGESKGGAA